MSVIFQSQVITHNNESMHQLNDVVIEDSIRNITFAFTKNGQDFNPASAEYSFTTKILSMVPKAGQLNSGDQLIMKLVTREA